MASRYVAAPFIVREAFGATARGGARRVAEITEVMLVAVKMATKMQSLFGARRVGYQSTKRFSP